MGCLPAGGTHHGGQGIGTRGTSLVTIIFMKSPYIFLLGSENPVPFQSFMTPAHPDELSSFRLRRISIFDTATLCHLQFVDMTEWESLLHTTMTRSRQYESSERSPSHISPGISPAEDDPTIVGSSRWLHEGITLQHLYKQKNACGVLVIHMKFPPKQLDNVFTRIEVYCYVAEL